MYNANELYNVNTLYNANNSFLYYKENFEKNDIYNIISTINRIFFQWNGVEERRA